MNYAYYNTEDENFKQALILYETEFTHSQLIELLKSGNIPQRQIAALKLENIFSEDDANTLISNLTGQDGKIREAISLKFSEFMENSKSRKFFNKKEMIPVYLDAITDINGNICRNVISGLSNFANNDDFCRNFCPLLLEQTMSLVNIVSKFTFTEGKYKVNKDAFKLYWCLEAIYTFAHNIDIKNLKPIIIDAATIEEYTIKEKIAKILSKKLTLDDELLNIKSTLKKDSNFYVSRY